MNTIAESYTLGDEIFTVASTLGVMVIVWIIWSLIFDSGNDK